MGKIDNTPDANAIDTTVNIDTPKRVVTISQRNDRFALRPDSVTFPFDALKVLAAQVTLIDAGMLQVGPVADGGGEGNTSGADAARRMQ